MRKRPLSGMVYFIGAGAGSADLITLRGHDLIHRADTIVYDYLVDRRLLKGVRSGVRLLCCADLGKGHAGTDAAAQQRINRFLIAEARSGRVVARLKNGDPAIFGRLHEELSALNVAHIVWEVVPGVTSASVAAASAGISLTERGVASEVVFVTGRESRSSGKSVDWEMVSRSGTVVVYMGVEKIGAITQKLMRVKAVSTPVAIVRRAGWADEQVFLTTLERTVDVVRQKKIVPPAIFIVGEAVGQARVCSRASKVLVTGTSLAVYQGRDMAVHVPMITIEPLKKHSRLDKALHCLDQFDWLLFTSRYGVDFFFRRLGEKGRDARDLHAIKIAVIGASTAQSLRMYGIKADVVAKEETSKGILKALENVGMRGARVLVPGSSLSRGVIAEGLRGRGADVVSCPVYQNVCPRELPDLDLSKFREILFSSPSGVRNFFVHYGKPLKDTRLRCIGPVTQETAKEVFGPGYLYAIQNR